MKLQYIEKRFQKPSLLLIGQTNTIVKEYAAQGFDLTLRQLHYQFVARDLYANTSQNYNRLKSVVSDGRLAGLIDWDAIVDRTRYVRSLGHWESPHMIVEDAARQFRIDKWKNQGYRPEVWIEKDALTGVIEGVCQENDVPFFSCRGYPSQSEVWRASQRMDKHVENGQTPYIIHLGDHDPSGVDMSRDIVTRIRDTFRTPLEFDRLALTMAQVEEFRCPPNFAKLSDSRSPKYIKAYGNESWELDALDPVVMADLIQDAIDVVKDHSQWVEDKSREEESREKLFSAASELERDDPEKEEN